MGLGRTIIVTFLIISFCALLVGLSIKSLSNADEMEALAKLACEDQELEYFAMHKILERGNTSQVLCSDGEGLRLVELHHRNMIICERDRFGY